MAWQEGEVSQSESGVAQENRLCIASIVEGEKLDAATEEAVGVVKDAGDTVG